MGSLRDEIRQKAPFRGPEEEVVLALVRTADLVLLPVQEALRGARLSQSQYNVLRILRGAGEALPCGEVGARMVRRDPDLTRLLDRLEERGLVARERGSADRRQVRAAITKEGRRLLASLDGAVDEALRATLAHVPKKRLRALLELLDEVRGGASPAASR